MSAGRLDLVSLARRALAASGFHPDLSPAAAAELSALPREAPLPAGVRDLRPMLFSSIDNHESRDLDQVELAESIGGGRIRLLVGIADVDAVVARGSGLDQMAAWNTTSVYTAGHAFPMLPDPVSAGLTSLLPDRDRAALVVEMVVEPDGRVTGEGVYRALLRNHAKLAYDEVGGFLEGTSEGPGRGKRDAALEAQLRLQDEAAQRLRALRHERGALELESQEARPVMRGGEVVGLELVRQGRARELIEDFMIAANGAMARFLDARGVSSLRRVVSPPARWPRLVELARSYGESLPAEPSSSALAAFLASRRRSDPARFVDVSLSVVKLMGPGQYQLERPGAEHPGHFGLAVQDYTHSTAPNRRFADLVLQRLLKASLSGAVPPYSDEDLEAIAARCNERASAAQKVERLLRKAAAAALLAGRIGERFDALVTGSSPRGTYVRLLSPPAEGRVVSGEAGLDVGDRVRVRLTHVSAEQGFIDFVRD